MRNKFRGTCFLCHNIVNPGEGFFQRNSRKSPFYNDLAGKWLIRCTNCVGKGNKPSSDTKPLIKYSLIKPN